MKTSARLDALEVNDSPTLASKYLAVVQTRNGSLCGVSFLFDGQPTPPTWTEILTDTSEELFHLACSEPSDETFAAALDKEVQP